MCNFVPKFYDWMNSISLASRLNKLLGLVVAGCMAVVGTVVAQEPFEPLFAPQKREVRAVWLTTIKGLDWPTTRGVTDAAVVKQKKELTDILDRLQQARVNVVLLQTRVRGNLIYPSTIETWCESISGKAGVSPGYDPLAFAIEECHKRGMELHAWMVAVPLGGDDVHKEMGNLSTVKRHRAFCKKFRNNWYLNPGHPESKRYLASLVNELVSRYDVDGVHLDYIRYPDRPKSFPDAVEYRKYAKGRSLYQWRRDNITEMVRAVYQEVKDLKPWVKVSTAPLGKYRDTKRYPSRGWNGYHAVYQEAQEWMREGIQDMIFPMLYYRGNDFYPFVLDWKEQSYGRMVVPGLGIYFLHPSEGDWQLHEVESQLNFIRWSGCDGEAYFRSRFLTDNNQGLYDRLQDNYYYTSALLPPMTWIDSVPPESPAKRFLQESLTSTRLCWSSSADNLSGGVHYNVYASSQYPVDIADPRHLVGVRLADTLFTHHWVRSKEEKVYYAVTAMDRYGNESEAVEMNAPVTTKVEEDVPTLRLIPENGVVRLPDELKGKWIVVTAASGRLVNRLPFNRQLRVENLPEGCYRMEVVGYDGRSYHAGSLVLCHE